MKLKIGELERTLILLAPLWFLRPKKILLEAIQRIIALAHEGGIVAIFRKVLIQLRIMTNKTTTLVFVIRVIHIRRISIILRYNTFRHLLRHLQLLSGSILNWQFYISTCLWIYKLNLHVFVLINIVFLRLLFHLLFILVLLRNFVLWFFGSVLWLRLRRRHYVVGLLNELEFYNLIVVFRLLLRRARFLLI